LFEKLIFGQNITISFEFWLLLFIAFEVHRIKKMGLAHRPINKVENIYECFIRVLFYILYK